MLLGLELAATGLLLVLSAFFSGSETAFFSLSKVQLKNLQEKKKKNIEKLTELLEDEGGVLVTVLFGNTLVNVAASVVATSALFEVCDLVGLDKIIGIVAAMVLMPVLLLVVGEVTPKTFAFRNSENYALMASPSILFFKKLFSPLVKVLKKLTVMTTVPTGKARPMPYITEEEVRTLFRVSGDDGLFEEDEQEMIDSIFEFGNTVVKEVMVPRTDMVALDIELGRDEVLDLIKECGHSRIPVYQDSIDNIVGILYAKDMLQFIRDPDRMFNLVNIMRKAYFVPENKNIDELLKEFKERKMHLAIVVDEYGGTSGLATMEDLIEEIVGDILDEYDVEEKVYEVVDSMTVMADGKMDITEFNEIFDVDLPEDDAETLGGFLLDQFGKVPSAKQNIKFEGLSFIVEKVIKHRITSIRILFEEQQIPEKLLT